MHERDPLAAGDCVVGGGGDDTVDGQGGDGRGQQDRALGVGGAFAGAKGCPGAEDRDQGKGCGSGREEVAWVCFHGRMWCRKYTPRRAVTH